MRDLNVRSAVIGVVVATALICVGFGLVGFDPTDGELRLVCWPAAAVGFAVTMWLEHRRFSARPDEQREQR